SSSWWRTRRPLTASGACARVSTCCACAVRWISAWTGSTSGSASRTSAPAAEPITLTGRSSATARPGAPGETTSRCATGMLDPAERTTPRDAMDPPSAPDPAAPLRPGDAVDQYEVVRLLGAGGMSWVYLARDRVLGRDAALKLIRARAGDDD